MTHTNKDWEGRDIPLGEAKHTIITVWNVQPHANKDYDYLVVRPWQDALDAIRSTAKHLLEADETPTVSEPSGVENMGLADVAGRIRGSP